MIRLFSLGLALIATAASAAPEQNFDKMSPSDARIVLRDYAQCVVKDAPDEALRAVIEDWEGSRIVDGRTKLFSKGCVSAAGFIQAIRFNGESLRAALAEELIGRLSPPTPGADVLGSLPALAFHMPYPVKTTTSKGGQLPGDIIAAQQRAFDMKVGKIAGQQVAECVVRTHPDEARTLFTTKIGSDEEMQALKALSPLLGACVPADQKIAFDRASLRGDFALSYYRLLMASRGVAWAGDASTNGAQN